MGSESLLHAQQAGELLTGLGGHPTLQIAAIPESYQHSVKDILEESVAHEREALTLYKEFLKTVEGRSIYLEEFARTQIGQEEMHGLELRKMLRDIGAAYAPHEALVHAVEQHSHAPGRDPPRHRNEDEEVTREEKRRKKDKKKDKHAQR